jgi:hypothetical protein
MKKTFILLGAILVFATMHAQYDEIKFGLKGGFNFSNFDLDDSDGTIGFYIGGLADLPVSGNFHVQGELLYSKEGADQARLDYLRIPIMAKYYVIEGLSLEAGPQFGFKVGADDFVNDYTKSFDFGIGAGIAYEFFGGFFIEARYNLGLTDINDGFKPGFEPAISIDTPQPDFKNTNFQIGTGIRY